jgi:hypothetical protein
MAPRSLTVELGTPLCIALLAPSLALGLGGCSSSEDTGSAGAGPTATWTTTDTGVGGGAATGGTGGTAGGGATGGSGATGGTGGTGAAGGSTGSYAHTITIDGTNDFVVADERFATTTGDPFYGYVAWDQAHLYVGMEGPDLVGGAGSDAKWLVIYVGGTPGTTTGVSYGQGSGTIQPDLPFVARYQIQWRANNTLTAAYEWGGSAWLDAGWDFTGDVWQNGNYVELRIPRSAIGSPSTVELHLSLINEASGGEYTFAGVPSTSFTDAADPDYGSFFAFDLTGAGVPTSHSPQ